MITGKQNKALVYDTCDDRREIHHLLERLPPWQRIRWLEWCCELAKQPGKPIGVVSPMTKGLTMEVFLDFWLLVANYGLDPEKALAGLVEVVKGKLDVLRS